MIGVVLVTHGRLAQEFRTALEHVVGEQQSFATISIDQLMHVITLKAEETTLLKRSKVLTADRA